MAEGKTAEQWKEEGNEAWKEKKYEEALNCYTKAIEIDGNNHVYYSNRSAVYVCLGDGQKALEDAEKTLQIKNDWGKGYLRKGRAYILLGKHDLAKQTLEQGLTFEPENDQIKAAIQEISTTNSNSNQQNENATQNPEVVINVGEEQATKEEETWDPSKPYSKEDFEAVRRVMRCRNYYEVLEVSKDADETTVKTNYRKLARQLHPDKNSAPNASEAMKLLTEAYQTLTNPIKRSLYDRYVDTSESGKTYAQWEAEDPDANLEAQLQQLPAWLRCILSSRCGALVCLIILVVFFIPFLFIVFLLYLIICLPIACCCRCFCPKMMVEEEEEEGNKVNVEIPD